MPGPAVLRSPSRPAGRAHANVNHLHHLAGGDPSTGRPGFLWRGPAAGTLPSLAVVTLTPALAKIMGRRNLLLVATLLFCLGGITATLAPTFTTFIAGRVIQAVSSGVLAMFGLSAVARAVPESLRSRVFSLMSAMWIVPALIGPPF